MTRKETYYAIRIGDPRRHTTYFKLREGEMTPQLFLTRDAAQKAAAGLTVAKVQRVKIKAG